MSRSNVLILYTDQQRWDALCANGNAAIKTPNLDRLASEGANFQNYFVQNPV
jgi:arylsulfatase